MRKLLISVTALLYAFVSEAGNIVVGTNFAEWAFLGTMNMEAGYAFSEKWSINMHTVFNPWNFPKGNGENIRRRIIGGDIGIRYWPWYNNSGWFAEGKVGCSSYNICGITGKGSEEGERYGIGLNAGYALMLGKKINIEFGAGFTGGLKNYKKYGCSPCGRIEDAGRKPFLIPDDIMIQIVYIF